MPPKSSSMRTSAAATTTATRAASARAMLAKASSAKATSAKATSAKAISAKAKKTSRVSVPAIARSMRTRDPNYQCRVDIYDELRAKCNKDRPNCKGILADGSILKYSDCEALGATAADLLENFPVGKEENHRLNTLLKKEKSTGHPNTKDYDLKAAKKCLTRMWYGSEDKARLEACPPPERGSRMKVSSPKKNKRPMAKPKPGPKSIFSQHQKKKQKQQQPLQPAMLGFL